MKVQAVVLALGIALALVCTRGAIQGQTGQPAAAAPSVSAAVDRTLLDKYCVSCHGGRNPTAGLAISALNANRIGESAESWEKVVAKLRSRSMPPAGLPRPDAASYDKLASSLEAALDAAAAARPNPGRSVLHRLNRAEFTNAIRDLLEIGRAHV